MHNFEEDIFVSKLLERHKMFGRISDAVFYVLLYLISFETLRERLSEKKWFIFLLA